MKKFIPLLLSLLLTSCAIFLNNEKSSRGSLSSAVAKSENADPHKREITTNTQNRNNTDRSIDFNFRKQKKSNKKTKNIERKSDYNDNESVDYDNSFELKVDSNKNYSLDSVLGNSFFTVKSPLTDKKEAAKTDHNFSLTSSPSGSRNFLVKPNISVMKSDTSSSEIKKETSDKSDHTFSIGVEVQPQLIASKTLKYRLGGEILIGGAYHEGCWFFFRSGFHSFNIKESSELYQKLNGTINSFLLGLTYQQYFSNYREDIVSPHFTVNAAWEIMMWDYQNPLIDTAEGKEISGDRLSSCNIGAAAGLTLFKQSHVRIDLNIGCGFRVYKKQTFKRFDNDIFKPDLYLQSGLRLWFSKLK